MNPTTDPGGLTRRSLLGRSAAGVGIALTGNVTGLFGTGIAAARGRLGYGPLVPDPAGLLSLPRGFSYELLTHAGVTTLASGRPSPGNPDGAAAFVRKRGAGSVIVLNHELGDDDAFPVPHVDGLVYDPQAPGGTTNLEVDRRGRVVRQYVSLAGTLKNCAGGRSPWGTWLTCEEAEDVLGKPHGYVFEVDPHDRRANRDPKPIKALGRYAHEALVVEPGGRGRIYLTEDAGNPHGLLYRWTPPRSALPLGPGALRGLADDAGALTAMKASTRRGAHVPDLSAAKKPGTRFRVEWVTVPDRDARTVSTRKQFGTGDVTRSRKLEGMWWGDGGAYFVCSFARTTDGSVGQHDGQVWFLDPREDTIELRLHFAYTPGDQDSDPDGPDTITVSAHGGLIIAEDGDGRQHLVGSTDDGETFSFARNEHPDASEFAGPCFSPDGRTLFVSVQSPGLTYAITGPFKKLR